MMDQDEINGGVRDASTKVLLTIDNRVARITLNNPPLNVITIEILHELAEAVNEAARTEAICAVIIEAAPESRAFCAGLGAEDHHPELAYQFLDALHGLARTIDFHSK